MLCFLCGNNDLDTRLVENHAGSTEAVLIRWTVPTKLRGIDLAGISPLLCPCDTAAADLVIVRFFVPVDVLVADADLVAVPLEVDSIMVVERRIVPVTMFAAHLTGEMALSP